jgi:hypothetical protein
MRIRHLFVILALVLSVSGCRSNNQTDAEADGGDSAQPGTLTVDTTYSEGKGGMLYIEGAMTEVVVRDESGAVVGRHVEMPAKPMTFADLTAGSYSVSAALRPCDGNCGYLDGPTDQCETTVTLDGDLHVTVDFVVGSPCEVRVA